MISEFYLIFCSYSLHYREILYFQGQKPLAKTPPNGSRSPTGYQLFSRKNHENTPKNVYFPVAQRCREAETDFAHLFRQGKCCRAGGDRTV